MNNVVHRSEGLLTKRFFIRFVCLFVLAGGVILPVVKFCCYEALGGARQIRHAVGGEVAFFQGGHHYQGTLVRSGYRFNDKWGWFDLYVVVQGGQSAGSTGLSPSESRRVLLYANR